MENNDKSNESLQHTNTPSNENKFGVRQVEFWKFPDDPTEDIIPEILPPSNSIRPFVPNSEILPPPPEPIPESQTAETITSTSVQSEDLPLQLENKMSSSGNSGFGLVSNILTSDSPTRPTFKTSEEILAELLNDQRNRDREQSKSKPKPKEQNENTRSQYNNLVSEALDSVLGKSKPEVTNDEETNPRKNKILSPIPETEELIEQNNGSPFVKMPSGENSAAPSPDLEGHLTNSNSTNSLTYGEKEFIVLKKPDPLKKWILGPRYIDPTKRAQMRKQQDNSGKTHLSSINSHLERFHDNQNQTVSIIKPSHVIDFAELEQEPSPDSKDGINAGYSTNSKSKVKVNDSTIANAGISILNEYDSSQPEIQKIEESEPETVTTQPKKVRPKCKRNKSKSKKLRAKAPGSDNKDLDSDFLTSKPGEARVPESDIKYSNDNGSGLEAKRGEEDIERDEHNSQRKIEKFFETSDSKSQSVAQKPEPGTTENMITDSKSKDKISNEKLLSVESSIYSKSNNPRFSNEKLLVGRKSFSETNGILKYQSLLPEKSKSEEENQNQIEGKLNQLTIPTSMFDVSDLIVENLSLTVNENENKIPTQPDELKITCDETAEVGETEDLNWKTNDSGECTDKTVESTAAALKESNKIPAKDSNVKPKNMNYIRPNDKVILNAQKTCTKTSRAIPNKSSKDVPLMVIRPFKPRIIPNIKLEDTSKSVVNQLARRTVPPAPGKPVTKYKDLVSPARKILRQNAESNSAKKNLIQPKIRGKTIVPNEYCLQYPETHLGMFRPQPPGPSNAKELHTNAKLKTNANIKPGLNKKPEISTNRKPIPSKAKPIQPKIQIAGGTGKVTLKTEKGTNIKVQTETTTARRNSQKQPTTTVKAIVPKFDSSAALIDKFVNPRLREYIKAEMRAERQKQVAENTPLSKIPDDILVLPLEKLTPRIALAPLPIEQSKKDNHHIGKSILKKKSEYDEAQSQQQLQTKISEKITIPVQELEICSNCLRDYSKDEMDEYIREEILSLNDKISKCRSRIKLHKEDYERRQINILEINQVIDSEEKELDERLSNLDKLLDCADTKTLEVKDLEVELERIAAVNDIKLRKKRSNKPEWSSDCINISNSQKYDTLVLAVEKEVQELIAEMEESTDTNWNPENFLIRIEDIFQHLVEEWKNFKDLDLKVDDENVDIDIMQNISAPGIISRKDNNLTTQFFNQKM